MSTGKSKISRPESSSPHDIAVERASVEVRIDGLAAGGRGVGRVEVRVWFV